MENNNKNYIIAGLCEGRHPIPVSEYIYGTLENVLDFSSMRKTAEAFIVSHCNPSVRDGQGVSQDDATDVRVWGGTPLHVVVTGLTPCTTEVMWACAVYGIALTLWHYDRDTGKYVPQSFNFSGDVPTAKSDIEYVSSVLNREGCNGNE